MECRVTLTRSQAHQELDIPFTVFIENTDWPVVVVVKDTNLVKKADDGSFNIHLSFTGSPTDLTRVEEALGNGRVRAYVRAMEQRSYAQGIEGRGSVPNVYVELPTELWGRVTFVPPPLEEIDLEVLKKKEDD
jgi:hypothetical protein